MIEKLAKTIEKSRRIVFFGGAGVSTESGIPDFRSEDGLFFARQKYGHAPEELLSHSFFIKNPSIFFDYYRENLIHTEAKPNAAHIGIAKLESRGILSAVVTQNIDGLHQLAGSKNVFELHGSIWRNYCMECAETYALEYLFLPEFKTSPPLCKKCGGIVRPDVVLYEEGLYQETVSGAIEAIALADMLIVGGTSLLVYPAAGMIQYFRGENLVLLNRTPTSYDKSANMVFRDPIGTVFTEVSKRLGI